MPDTERSAAAWTDQSLWVARKDGRTLTCFVRPHPLGRELLLLEGDDLRRSQVFKPDRDPQLDADQWRRAAEGRGWVVEVRS